MSIQIVGLRPYFSAASKELKLREKFFNVKAESVESLFKNIDKIIEHIPQKERYNLFWTAAHCKPATRELEYQDIIPFDIDDIDNTRKEEYIQPICTALNIKEDKCPIIFTGNGIQFIVGLKNKITDKTYFSSNKVRYKSLCTKVDTQLKRAGLPGKADSSVFSPARLLRLPKTRNVKPMDYADGDLLRTHLIDPPEDLRVKDSVLYKDRLNGSQFELEDSVTSVTPKPKRQLATYGIADTATMLTQCSFLKHVSDCPNETSEPEWYAAIGIAAYIDDNLCHDLSKGYVHYSPTETDLKIAQARAAQSGPTTCKHIEGIWKGDCKKCPHYGKVTSPIQIKSEEFIATAHRGFTTESVSAKGKLTLVRHYEDLCKYLNQNFKYKYIGDLKKHIIYNGTYWEDTSPAFLHAFSHNQFKPTPKAIEAIEFEKYMERACYEHQSFIQRPPPEGKLNLRNGVLDIASKSLEPHDPRYYFTYVLNYDYDPNATCPTWEHLLKTVTSGREHLMQALEEYLGYAIMGGVYKYAKALILSGSGNNGKSTFLDAMKEVFGQANISSASIESMQKNPFQAAQLAGKLLSLSNEQSPDVFSETGLFKALTGNDMINVQNKYEKPFDMTNRAKIVIAFNETPYLRDIGHGMLRRLMIIPFDEVLTKEHPLYITDINQKIAFEKAGILNRLIQAYLTLERRGGFQHLEESDAATYQICLESDAVLEWYTTYIIKTDDKEDKLFLREAYDHYKAEMEVGKSDKWSLSFRGFTKRFKQIAKSKQIIIGQVRIGETTGIVGAYGIKINYHSSYTKHNF